MHTHTQLGTMNELPWHRVDVDCRHMHAHAAIVLRPSRRNTVFKVNVDCWSR
jgi:hypothetical protein